ncbi:MAG TPA: outer membrane beta-barrel family protein [Candidatus Alistipes merdigallinarum]|nr:outer membrane beta-barrel family protein [Candidatus Alistipes merdigallinarum]
MRMSGDTLIFNAEAIPVLPGDETMILINRIPGFKASETGVTYAGRSIARTYVDGKPLFGNDASTALQYLEAHEVIDIQIYEEPVDEDKFSGFDSGRKQTVISLITRSKPNRSTNIRAEAGYGADIDKNAEGQHNSRYKASAEYRSFAVGKQFNIKAGSFNSNTGNGYSRTTDASIGFLRTWKEKTTLSGNYHLNNNYRRTQSISRQVYFPSEQYQTRTYDDTSQFTNKDMTHNLSFMLERRGKYNFLTFRPSATFSIRSSNNYRGALNTIDGEELNRVRTSQRNDTRSYSVNETLSWSKSFNKSQHRIYFTLIGGLSQNDINGWQIDSVASNNERTYLNNTTNGYNRSLSASVNYSFNINQKNYFSTEYSISYVNSGSERIAINQYTGQIDSSLTSNYTQNNTTHKVSVNYRRRIKKISITSTLQYKASLVNKDELFMDTHHDRVVFQSIMPTLEIYYPINQKSRLSFNYSGYTYQPSIEQLRNELNYSNPLYLSGGNPNLRQSRVHSFGIHYTRTNTTNASSLHVSLTTSITRNAMAMRQIFFTEETPLPEYDGYIASKGATLTLPTNINGTKSVRGGFDYSRQLASLKSSLSISSSLNYSRTPSYIGDKLYVNDRITPDLSFNIFNNQSAIYQIGLGSTTAYNYTSNHTSNIDRANNNTINQTINLNGNLNIFKRLYITANYNYSLYHNFSYDDGDVNTHLMNVTIGYKFLKKRQLDVNFRVFDLLNQVDNFSTSVMNDYISYYWTQRPGRYFMFNISYRLNKLDKNVKIRVPNVW